MFVSYLMPRHLKIRWPYLLKFLLYLYLIAQIVSHLQYLILLLLSTLLGILLYEMLYGYTPFRGKTRQKTFANILHKDLRFPGCISVSIWSNSSVYSNYIFNIIQCSCMNTGKLKQLMSYIIYWGFGFLGLLLNLLDNW